MSRHRKVRAMDYDEEYDDFYGDLDEEDFNLEEEDFETKYLSSGIDLKIDESNNGSTKNQHPISIPEEKTPPAESSTRSSLFENSITPNLTKMAIQHLNMHQWQLPLMDMDEKFRDKTYYKHYSDLYISSLRSKLGHFLADNRMLNNPMKYHVKNELDNYKKYSKMFHLLTDYYQSLARKNQPRERAIAEVEQKPARFEFSGTKKQPQTQQQQKKTKSQLSTKQPSSSPAFSSQKSKPKEQFATSNQPLSTLVEKRKATKEKVKNNAEPSAVDLEAFRIKAVKVTQEYNELMKSSRGRLNLVVVGHVDAGKSTLVGHLLYKLGCVNNKQMHRYEVDSQRLGKSSFKFAWVMDETDQERARGVTIDLALTKFETAHKSVVLLDAPGHVDFVPAVISGAAQADAALLVVDATRGEFETGFLAGGQTREHTFLVRSLGVKSLIVVINKMDSVDWNPHRFNDILEQLKPFLKQVGFDLKQDVTFIPASGLTGENLVERRQEKLRKQSSHPQLEHSSSQQLDQSLSLIEAIDRMKQPERMIDKPTRISISDIFKGMSSGVHLAGKVISGKLEPKQKLLLLPPNETCEVKSIDTRISESSNQTKNAYAGDIVTLTCVGIDMSKYYRGSILCDPVLPCNVTNRFQARIIMFQNASTILTKGAPIEVHINGTYESGQIRKLLSLLNKNTGELIQNRPRCIVQNASAIIQLRLDRVVACELYESNKDLGRFLMRSFGKTIAAGLITKIKSAKVKKASNMKMKSKG